MPHCPSTADSPVSGAVASGRATRRARRSLWRWFALPALGFVALVYVVPMGFLLVQSFTYPELGLHNYERILTQPGYLWTIARTLGVSAASAILALLIGYPIAYVAATTPSAGLRRFLIFCVVAPYLTSILIRTFAWQVLLGRVGPINAGLQALGFGPVDLMFNTTAVIIALTHFLLPLTVLPLISVMRQVDLSLLRAARSLGAGPATAFARVFVPGSMPGVEVGLVLSFVYGVGAFVIPALVGGNSGRMLGALIQQAIEQQADFGLAAAAAVLLALGIAAVIGLFRAGMSGNLEQLASPTRVSASSSARAHGALWRRCMSVLAWTAARLDRAGLSRHGWMVRAFAVVLALLVLLPQLIAIPVSFSSARALIVPPPGWSLTWYRGFAQPEWMEPLWASVQIGVGVAIISTVLGTLAAVGVVRGFRPRAAAAANLFLLVPLLFPTVVAAAAFYLSFVHIGLTDSLLGIALAHVTIALPFVFAIVSANLRTLDQRYEWAAASLGAGLWTQLRRILLPLLAGGIATGLLFAFLTSFDEAAIAVFLSGVFVKTLPRRMYEALALESDPTIGVVAVLTMSLAATIAIGAALLRRRFDRGNSQRNVR